MWIRKIPATYFKHTSEFYESLMLWKNENVYVMDNHMSAAWCWLQSCNPAKKYNFMHIDRHYDMKDNFYEEDLKPLFENPHMSYEEFKNIKRDRDSGYCVFSWDNYIMAAYTLQPNWFHTNVFMTHKQGSQYGDWGHKHFEMCEKDLLYMDWYLSQCIHKKERILNGIECEDCSLPWIVNLDLDVFYTRNEPRLQLFSNEYIRLIAKLLNDSIKNIQVLTIALSPDCLGGKNLKEKWANAFRILKIMSGEIENLKSFPFPED